MERINFIDFFYESEACRLSITTEQLDILMGLCSDEEVDQLLGDDFQPILDKYLKINNL